MGSTPFSPCFKELHFKSVPHHPWFGIDNGMVTVDRTNDPFRWNTAEPTPTVLPDGPTCAMHWPQVLGRDPRNNGEVVERWVKLLKQINGETSRILSRNTTEFVQQLLHYAHTRMTWSQGRLVVDASETFRQGWAGQQGSVLVKGGECGQFGFVRQRAGGERQSRRWTSGRTLDHLPCRGLAGISDLDGRD